MNDNNEEEEEDLKELIALIADMNAHQDLNMKLHNHTKIEFILCNILDSADSNKSDIDGKVREIMNQVKIDLERL